LDAPHQPVLLQAILEGLNVRAAAPGWFIDGTVGAGGHAQAILETAPQAHLLGIDRDPRSLAIAAERLAGYGQRVSLRQGSYTQMGQFTASAGFPLAEGVDGIVLDLGIASMHVDDAARGFSFRADAPLDMRFDPDSDIPTAAEMLNTCPLEDLVRILSDYGEERHAKRIARAIADARPLQTTHDLVRAVERGLRGVKYDHLHPATRTFQAVRIAVNDELAHVERVLPLALSLLRAGGRLAVISFHSLEDRLVKTYFHREARDCLCPPQQIICTCGHKTTLREITRKPLTPDAAEMAANPRSRSAKLRIVERLAVY